MQLTSGWGCPGRSWCTYHNSSSGPGRRWFWSWVPSVSAGVSQARPSVSVCSVFGSECPVNERVNLRSRTGPTKHAAWRRVSSNVNKELLMYLWYFVDEVLVLVTGRDKGSLFQVTEVPQDLPLLLLKRQLAVLQHCRAALQPFWGQSVLDGPPLYNLGMLRLLEEQSCERSAWSS